MSAEDRVPPACVEVRSLLAAFLRDEIPPDRSLLLQEHLDACADCRRTRAFEESFDSLLARGLGRQTSSASLPVRIHEALRREDGAPRGGLPFGPGRVWTRWAALAAALAVVLLAVQVVGRRVPSELSQQPPPPGTQLVEQVRTGTLVCAECERERVPAQHQRGCRHFGHHSAFKCERTGLWEFVETDLTRPLLTDADRIGERVEIRGVFLDDLHYVRVTSYRYLGESQGPSTGL